ncbi:P-loop containing nucleoside triphosphate hydrolase protein [Polyplosphaeria fusca]|uniref:P-loop containing nucleoside triphosphate hydrolase protein n=1 Tax=Polyplosphaeria fusca TaxID=682080 RepID=A0A9P4QN38_9PLEO|nr:P-loop containing nucleoside triphosphate hydrolase protein [Polyplosphaeria fusca]
MAGPTRASTRNAAMKPAIPSSQPTLDPSSGSTVMDDNMNATRLSQTLEPLEIGSTKNPTSTSHGDVSVLGAGIKDLMSTMSELQKLGLGQYDVPVAKCVVCGDQSAGKSSVIEAISGIKVPRAGGTCTRCPMFIELKSSEELDCNWEATVKLRTAYDYDPQCVDAKSQKYPPWFPKAIPIEVDFGHTNDQEELADIIFQAQLALLNPKKDFRVYATRPPSSHDKTSDAREADFSPNVLCISITAPGLPDLSFFDLPGVIIARGNRKKEVLKKFIEDLVTEYVEDSSALVLLTSSLEMDWDISSHAAELITKTNATSRTVGVLTKPDRIDNPARYIDIRKALDGSADPLGHGYHVVKQPDQSSLDRAISHTEARTQEMAFFDQNQPWSTDLRIYQEKFGTLNLQVALSKKLVAMSLGALPLARARISDMLAGIEDTLTSIPPPPTRDVTGVVNDALRFFTETLRKEMLGEKNANTWRLKWDELRKEFTKQLQDLRPRVAIRGKQDQLLSRTNDGLEMIDLVTSDEEEQRAPITPSKRKQPSSTLTTPSKGTATPSSSTNRPPKKPKFDTEQYDLDQLHERLYRMSSAKLAHAVNPDAIEVLMLEPLRPWGKQMQKFYAKIEQALTTRIDQVLVSCLGQWRQNLLFKETRETTKRFFKLHFDEQRTVMGPEAYEAELAGPYFHDTQYYDSKMDRFLNKYKETRFKIRKKVYFTADGGIAPKNSDDLAKKEHLKSTLTNDPYAQEVEVIAKIHSYYDCASIRFHEAICMRIESKLFRRLSENLLPELKEALELTDDKVYQRCVQLLAEDSGRETRRRDLVQQREVLLAGQKLLDNLDEKYKDEGSFALFNGGTVDDEGDEHMASAPED